ncbi:uncharacterized protein LOC102456264 isoform X1 [Pelodiscus sinensis]|uniref:uncharacterized protein LOC102456264 isoform X1 n=1 Tax=Pelodiscus sinensis TaxID=13735 RepID=UPI003F6D3948
MEVTVSCCEQFSGKCFEDKIKNVLAYIRSNTYPEGMNKAGRFNLRRFASKFSLEDGTLYHSAKGRKVVHTMKEALTLFERYHDSFMSGHEGIFKTRNILTSKYYWPGMTRDIADWVARCPTCQKHKKKLHVDNSLRSIKLPDMNTVLEDYCREYDIEKKFRHEADIEMALSNISKAQEKQQRHYVKRKSSKYGEVKFDVGNSVLLLNARRRTRKGGVLEPTYRGPYKITSIEGKTVKLENMSGKMLGTKYSIAHLKPFKEPPQLAPKSTSEESVVTEITFGNNGTTNTFKKIRKVDGPESHNYPVQPLKDIKNTATEEEEIGEDLPPNDKMQEEYDFGDMIMEDVEDKKWFLKVKFAMNGKQKKRLEAKVKNYKLYGTSFHCLKPRSWICDEVIDAYFSCLVEKSGGKVEAISTVVATQILLGRQRNLKSKSRFLHHDIILLPYNAPNHWVLAIAQMDTQELVIIDPLCEEMSYERKFLRNWRNFIKGEKSNSTSNWKCQIVSHNRQIDGYNCGPLILKFAEMYLQLKDVSSVDISEEANNEFRRHIAILLMKESEGIEEFCIYCNRINCEKKSEECTMVQCDSCKRWAHMPCIPEGITEEMINDEKTEYKCQKCS